MCGIVGFCDFEKLSSAYEIKLMSNKLAHRGPDDEGTHIWEYSDKVVAFGHRRLSIIDTSLAGHQPMFSVCRRYCIVFNGEIYNYKELKKELLIKGVSFNSSSDTEVLLALYQHKGVSFIESVIGMFSLVIYDLGKQKLIAFRDRLGVKPFYYYWKNGLFLFGSELKALVVHSGFQKSIDLDALGSYFRYGYIGGENAIYNNTHKLAKGHYLTFDLRKQVIGINKYWDIKHFFGLPKIKIDHNDLEIELKKQLIKAFKFRMVSDVPVGVLLSGGYDSALLTSILSEELGESLKTFTIGFNESELNEAPVARKISNQFETTHYEFLCSEDDAQQIVELLPTIYDEPFSDPSSIPTLLVCNKASSHVKVVLSADGGDENFAGYNRYVSYYKKIKNFCAKGNLTKQIANKMYSFHSKPLNSFFRNFLHIKGGNYCRYFSDVSAHVSEFELKKILPGYEPNFGISENQGIEKYDQILLWDLEHYLPDNVLTKIDRASMSVGLESREPLLDHKLIEFAAQIPFELKYFNGIQKYPIKNLVHNYISPGIIDLPKRGFSPPLNKWINGVFNEEYRDLTTSSFLKNQGLINYMALNRLINQTNSLYLKDRIKWSVFILQKWHNRWMN